MLIAVPEILPRFFRRLQEIEDLRRIAKIILEGGEVENEAGLPLRASADGHRDDRRRGLPMIGRGVSGSTNHTDPLRAVLAKEARGELWRWRFCERTQPVASTGDGPETTPRPHQHGI